MAVTQAEYDLIHRRTILWLAWPEAPRDPMPAALCTYTNLDPNAADYLLQVFPRARVAYLVRNGVEVVASRMRFEPFASDSFEENCRRWSQSAGMAAWVTEHRDVAGLVRHEALRDPERTESTLASVLALVGVDFERACADVVRGRVFHPTDAADNLEKRADRWQTWSDAERDTFARSCQDGMRQLDYPLPWLPA